MEFLWITLVFLIIVYLAIKSILFRYSRTKILGDKMPGPNPYPFIGSAFLFACDTCELVNVIQRLISKYGNVCRVWVARNLMVILTDPNDVQLILKNSRQLRKAFGYRYAKPFMGDGLVISEGDIWKSHRKMLTPAFHFKILEYSVQVMHKKSQTLVDILDEKVGKPEFDIENYVMKCTLDTVFGSSMGVEYDIQRSTDTSYFDAVVGAAGIFSLRQFNMWLQPEILFCLSGYQKKFTACIRHIDKITNEVIAKKKEIMAKKVDETINESGENKYTPFLDLLFQENLTDKEILEEVKTFMFAGHDTTGSGIIFLIYVLSQHTDVQDKIYEEIVSSSLFLGDSCPSIPQLNNLKYLESVIKETLRIYPSVPEIGRELLDDVVTSDGYVIPSGTNINIFIYGMHKNEKYFENCDKFEPERFLNEDPDRNPFAYIPFSAGPRNCIGQRFAMLELKIIICMLINKFKILPSNINQKPVMEFRVTLRSKNGIHIKLAHRNKQ